MSDNRLKTLADGELRRRQAISDAARRLREGGGFIYVASWPQGGIKIGCALDVPNRMKTLRIDARLASEPRLLAVMPGTIDQEKHLHRVLRRSLRKSHHGCRTEVYPACVLLHPAIPEALRIAA